MTEQFSSDPFTDKASSPTTQSNLAWGFIGGLVGMAVGAGIWAAITFATHYQIGWIAIGVGFLAGSGVRWLGQGDNALFGLIGGLLAGLGCILGNLLAIVAFAAQEINAPIWLLLINLDFSTAIAALIDTFGAMDLLFYGLAIYTGAQTAFESETQTPEWQS